MKLDELRKLNHMSQSFAQLQNTPQGHHKLMHAMREMGMDPDKLYQQLEMSGTYVNTHRDTSYGAWTVSLHSHAYGELIYCREAEGVEYLVGSHRYRLQPGDIIFVAPGVSHCPIVPEFMHTPYVRDVVWLSSEFMQRLGEIYGEKKGVIPEDMAPLRTAGTRWEFLGELFDHGIWEEERKKPCWETAVLGNTLMIVSYLKRIYDEQGDGKIRAEKPELTDRIAAYIEENYASRISASELTQRFFVSSSTISHLFKQKMGVSVYRYITQRRLIAAKKRIEAGEALEAVAIAVGFSDYSGFYRAFKQEFGISPRQYRKL